VRLHPPYVITGGALNELPLSPSGRRSPQRDHYAAFWDKLTGSEPDERKA